MKMRTTIPTITTGILGFFLAATLFFTNTVQAQLVVRDFTSNGSFTVPTGVTQITVEVWGAGGSGSTRTNNGAGGGGGGGAYSRSVLTVVPGDVYPYGVGTPGTSGTTPVAGGDSWFGNSTTVMAKGGGSVGYNVTTGAAGGLSASGFGTIRLSGGNGANGSGSNAGGGGSSAGTTIAGVHATNSNGANAPAGGGDGGNGRSGSQGNGVTGEFPGGGGGGAYRPFSGTRNGGPGGGGLVRISYVPAYRAQIVSVNTGAAVWCPGETRNIQVNITNTGQATWTTSNPHIRVGAKWNADADYFYRTDIPSHAPGTTQSYTISITAPATGGNNNITVDLVAEGICWFASNVAACGPGNTTFTTPNISIESPTAGDITGTSDACIGGLINLVSNATGLAPLTYTWNSSNPAVATVDNNGNVSGLTAGTSNITYTVTNGIGCSATSAPFTVTTVPGPSGTLTATENSGVAVNDLIICAGDPVTFYATAGFNAYIFKLNGTTVQSGTSRFYNTNTLNNGDVVTVDIISASNCLKTLDPLTITVTPLPTATLTATETSGVAHNDNTICAGDAINFAATPGFMNYAFKVNGTIVQNSSSNTFASSSLVNNDQVTVEVSNNNNCKFTTTAITVNVVAMPAGGLTVMENSGAAANDNIVCAGADVTFTANAGFSTYNFIVNGVIQQSSSSNVYTSNTLLNPSFVQVEMINTGNCAAISELVVISVDDLPVGTLSLHETSGTHDDGVICAGESIEFIATSGFANYNFKVNGISVQDGSSEMFATTSLNNGDVVSVEVTDNACTVTFNTLTITVESVPAISLMANETSGVAADDLIICEGGEVIFSTTAGFANYEFQVNGVTIQNGSNAIFEFDALANGDQVQVLVTGWNNCITASNIVTFTVVDLPVGTITATETSGVTANDLTICENASVTFTATAGFANYIFYVNNIPQQAGASNTYTTSSLNDADQVYVNLVSAEGCDANSNTLSITVHALPLVSLTITENSGTVNDGVICPMETVTATATSGFNNYVFYVDGVAVQNSSSAVYTNATLTTNATIQVVATNMNNCDGSSTIANISVLPLPVGTLSALETSGSVANDGKICVNASVSIEATAGFDNYIFRVNSAIVQNSGSNVYTAATFANGDVVEVEVLHSNGCATSFNTITMEVSDYPVVDVITGDLSVCLNSTTTLSNTTAGGVWSSLDAGIASVHPITGVVTGNAAGTTSIYYTVTNAAGCATQVAASVTVNSLPSPTLSGPNPFCAETIAVYETEAGMFNYIWTVAGGTFVSGGTSTSNTITIDWNLPGVKSIFVNYTDANGCSGVTSATVTGTTGTTPVITGVDQLCVSTRDEVYTTQSGQTDYDWNIPTGATVVAGGGASDNTITVQWHTAGNHSVSVNFSNVFGCSAPAPTVFTVVVNPVPDATIAGATSVCVDATAPQVTFTGSNGTAPYTFRYSINGGAEQIITTTSGNSASVSVPTNIAGVYTYTLVSVSDNNTCGKTIGSNVIVAVNPKATATVSGTANVCRNASNPQITFAGANGTAPYVFTYNINGGANQTLTSTGNTAVVNAATSSVGTYQYNLVSVTDANGCAQTQSGSATITVLELPAATIAGTATVCINGTAPVVTFTGSNGVAPYTFTYSINGGANQTILSTGNTATLNAPVNVPGVFVYALVSVQDASASTCTASVSGSATITVAALPIGGSIAGAATVCSGANAGTLTLSSYSGTVLNWQSSTDGGSTWSDIVNTTSTQGYNNLTQTTTYRAVVGNSVCASTLSTTVTVTVVDAPISGTVSGSATVCSDVNSGTVTLSGNTGSIVGWQSSTDGGSTWNNITNTTTSYNYSNLSSTTSYRAVINNGVCADVFSSTATISVNARPTAALSGTIQVCTGGTGTIVVTVSGTGSLTGMLNGSIPFSGTAPIINVTVSPTTNTVYTVTSLSDANCAALPANLTGSVTANVNSLPTPITVTPVSASFCLAGIQALSTAGALTTQSQTFTKTVNAQINDALFLIFFTIPGDYSNSLNVTGIPAGAIVTRVDVNVNLQHNRIGDIVVNLRAPNNNVLNLFNRTGGNGDHLVNTTFTSDPSGALLTSGSAPYTGFYAPAQTNGLAGGGMTSNVTSFSNLFSQPNGAWEIGFRDAQGGERGTLQNYSITIYYSIPSVTPSVWSPAAGLFTNAAATIPYDGVSALTTVYAKPATAGTHTYTAAHYNVNGCSVTAQSTITVNPQPTVNIIADYCSDPGYVRLTANSTPAATSYNWSNGSTAPFILVDIADSYAVTVATGNGCTNTASISIAQELIVNGDFESGNVGFSSSYTYMNSGTAGNMYPEGTYTVSPNPTFHHNNFWGRDHTSGAGNFMIVNGSNTTVNVWEQTVTVLPNTTYYFSAWAMSLNSVPPYAQLQFSVNGVNVGTTAVLGPRVNNNNPPFNWTRFYGTWTSGPTTTTAVVSIVDLQTAPGGNDFGIDDISFGTLSTFIRLEPGSGSDNQTICVNTPLTDIIYSAGSGSTGPVVTGLPAGVTSSFNGERVTISGTPTTPGVYTYNVTSTGTCNPVTVTGLITVTESSIVLTSGSNPSMVCRNVPMSSVVYTLGGAATGANVTGLPSGVTGSLSGNVYTIGGTPTAAPGTYNYTITTTGTCASKTISGAITIQVQTIVLTSGTTNQSRCVNTPINNLVFTLGGTATGATVSGLPAGVSGSYAGGVYVISGTATVAGVYPYTVTTTGSCNAVTHSGTITITPAATITLTSGVGSNIQTVCRLSAITPITFELGGGATSASVSGLPSGVTGVRSGNIVTISGAPTVAGGTFNFSVNTTGTCAQTNHTGTIIVEAATISLASGSTVQTKCGGVAITPIVYNIGGVATGATVTGLPSGVSGSYAAGQFTISGVPSGAGVYPYTVTTSGSGCVPSSLSGTITVAPESIGGTLVNQVVCSGEDATFILNGYQGSILRWERSLNGGATWTNISNTTPVLIITNVTQDAIYRVRVRNGSCDPAYSNEGGLFVGNIWNGTVSTDWFDANNWSGNTMPSVSCNNITISSTATYFPIITGSNAVVHNLIIEAGASLTVTNSSISVGGTITNNGSIDLTAGTLQLNGTVPQTLSPALFQNNSVQHLIIDNNSATGVTLTGELAISGSLNFTNNGVVLNTNDNLVLKSTADETAWVGNLTGKIINGDVTVERYIHTGTGTGMHGKGWQLLAVPTHGPQTIKNSWQEGATNINDNPSPGYGTMITGHLTTAVAQGFDIRTPAGSTIKTFNATTSQWDMVTSTIGQPIENPTGYMLLVRGDRTVITSSAAAIPTTLRTKGKLYMPGVNAPQPVAVQAGKYQSVGNPYASAIDLTSGGVQFNQLADVYYVWDPQLTATNSAYGLGGYQTFVKDLDGNYRVTPGGGSYGAPGSVKNTIESGQAFLVFSSQPVGGTNGSVSFGESAKIPGSNLVSRSTGETVKTLRTNLKAVLPGQNLLLDGIAVQFNDVWSNQVDISDALKIGNTGENLGIKRNGNLLAVERRKPVVTTDTIYFNLSQLRVQNYILEFNPIMLGGEAVEARLIDNHLQTSTPISLSEESTYAFAVTSGVTGSYASDRFMIVFSRIAGPLPVDFISVAATRNTDNSIRVQWETANEYNMTQYVVERSEDGLNFTGILTAEPSDNNYGSAVYVKTDLSPLRFDNFYRIKGVSTNGRVQYSAIVKVDALLNSGTISVYPNPVVDQTINVKFSGMDRGKYQVRLIHTNGQEVYRTQVELQTSNATHSLRSGSKLAAGKYILVIVDENNRKTNIHLLVK